MAARRKIIPQPRILLVGADPKWLDVVADAAARVGAALDVQPDVPSAVAWMLRPCRLYSHVLATDPLSPHDIDALTGMLDEVTLSPHKLLLLGCASAPSHAVRCVSRPDSDALVLALRGVSRPPVELPPLGAAELAEALHGGALRMRFQPIMDSDSLQPIAFEALARVHHPVRGILHPRDFIPLAVANGQDRMLTRVAARHIFQELQSLLLAPGLFVTLNVPITSLHRPGGLRRALELCDATGIAPANMLLEVLETSVVPDLEMLGKTLKAWQGAGFRLAIDDAGPALPHWRALLDLPFDMVKLDGALVAEPNLHALAERIVAAARERGLPVVAEGIENLACLDRARGWGVTALQGFVFSRPLPSMAVPVWLRQWNPASLGAGAVRAA